jgi:hypothetical protein
MDLPLSRALFFLLLLCLPGTKKKQKKQNPGFQANNKKENFSF